MRKQKRLRLLTIDVEPDWGIAGHRGIEEVMPALIRFLDERRIRATFFIVGELLGRAHPIIKTATMEHEIGCHGLTHRKLDRPPLREVEWELCESRRKLVALGEPGAGFRAPFFLAPRELCSLLHNAGYRYDSSLARSYPSRTNITPRRWAVDRNGPIPELPPTTMADGMTPFSNMRLLAPASRLLVDKRAVMFYMHLHDFLPPDTAGVLPPPLRWVLRRNAGKRAWSILSELLNLWIGRFVTCSEYLALITT